MEKKDLLSFSITKIYVDFLQTLKRELLDSFVRASGLTKDQVVVEEIFKSLYTDKKEVVHLETTKLDDGDEIRVSLQKYGRGMTFCTGIDYENGLLCFFHHPYKEGDRRDYPYIFHQASLDLVLNDENFMQAAAQWVKEGVITEWLKNHEDSEENIDD